MFKDFRDKRVTVIALKSSAATDFLRPLNLLTGLATPIPKLSQNLPMYSIILNNVNNITTMEGLQYLLCSLASDSKPDDLLH